MLQLTQFRSRLLFPFYFLFMLSNLLTTHSFTGDPCTNEDLQKQGICVSINNCELYNAKLRNPRRPLPQDTIELLKKVHCGFQGREPLVCCVNQTFTNLPLTTSTTLDTNPRIITEHENLNLINNSICGRSNTNRIFNGNKTGVFEFPWMALIAYRTGSSFDFRCGGTVINSKYVLTAAHCLHDLKGMTVAGVRLGEHDTTKDPDCEEDEDGGRLCAPSPRDFKISKIIVHPGYRKENYENDIGLVRISGNTNYNDYVRPICLPIGPELQNNNLQGQRPTVSGWGATEKGQMSSPDLLKVQLQMVPITECIRIYRKSITVTERQLCAGGSSEGSDSCQGDSGGPLVDIGYVDNQARFVQFGIVSFGPRRCATNGQPGVYTRVGHYIQWILDSIEP